MLCVVCGLCGLACRMCPHFLSPALTCHPQASCLLHSDMNFRGTLQVSMQSMANALAGGKGSAVLPKGVPEVVELQRFKDKSWFNQLLGAACCCCGFVG